MGTGSSRSSTSIISPRATSELEELDGCLPGSEHSSDMLSASSGQTQGVAKSQNGPRTDSSSR